MQCIETIRWHPYQIPFHANFITAHGVITLREGAIVEIVTEGGLSGLGEIAPLPSFAGTDLDTALAPLPTFAMQLRGKELVAALDFLYTQASVLPATTVCGLESALLDALGKCTKQSVTEIINTPSMRAPVKQHVPVNIVIGTQNTELTIARAHEAIDAGYSCIKLKMGNNRPEVEIARVAAVRNAIGLTIHLRLDANEAWTLAQAITILAGCAPYNVQYIEQPLLAGDLDGMCTLHSTVPIAIAADEAVYDLESARRVLASKAASILIIKPQLAGGLRMGRQIISEAVQHGVQCVITSTIETGIGLVGALHLAAASPEVTLECGLATLSLLTADLLVNSLTINNGFLTVPSGPGLGIALDRNALARYTIE
jgi:o-succinylbenzoate synthase